jgi:hypothetical protein
MPTRLYTLVVNHKQQIKEERMKNEYSQERLNELSQAFNLDGGGYEFTNHDILPGVCWEDPDDSYLGTGSIPSWAVCVFVFQPLEYFQNPKEWPESYVEEYDNELWAYKRIATGWFSETERECAWCGPGTGNEESSEECPRCDGDMYIICPDGVWAVYQLIEEEE